MVDPDDNKESIVTRLRGYQRTLVIVAASVILLGAAGIAIAQTPTVVADFEDGTTGIFGSSGTVISEDAIEGDYSYQFAGSDSHASSHFQPASTGFSFFLRMEDSGADSQVYFSDAGGDTVYHLDFAPNQNIRHNAFDGPLVVNYDVGTTYYFDYNLTASTLQVSNTSNGNIVYNSSVNKQHDDEIEEIEFAVFEQGTYTLDYIGVDDAPRPGAYSISGTVTDHDNQPIENATVDVEWQGSSYTSIETDMNGNYDIAVNNGTYNLTASKDGYFPDEATVDVTGEEVTQNFQLRNHSAALSINTRAFLEHGLSAPYSVTYESTNETSGRLVRDDATENATVTSGDTNVVTVDQEEEEVIATSDTSVNNQTYIEAEWTDPSDGETYTARQNVTVANETVDNLDILPPVNRFTASLQGGTDANPNDKTIMLLIIGAAAGAAASLIATSFAGVAALTMTMMLGWVMGMTGNGMAIVTVFIALFVGLNVAGNVDYTVRR